MPNRDLITFEPDNEYEVELLFDSCKEGVSDKGLEWYLYSFKYEGKEYGHFAKPPLHQQLKEYSRGDIVKISNLVNGWKVVHALSDGGPNKPPTPKRNNNYGITWGMCINNAVRIVIAKGELDDVLQRVNTVADGLMHIAVDGLKVWEQERHEKDQNTKPNGDGLPF